MPVEYKNYKQKYCSFMFYTLEDNANLMKIDFASSKTKVVQSCLMLNLTFNVCFQPSTDQIPGKCQICGFYHRRIRR